MEYLTCDHISQLTKTANDAEILKYKALTYLKESKQQIYNNNLLPLSELCKILFKYSAHFLNEQETNLVESIENEINYLVEYALVIFEEVKSKLELKTILYNERSVSGYLLVPDDNKYFVVEFSILYGNQYNGNRTVKIIKENTYYTEKTIDQLTKYAKRPSVNKSIYVADNNYFSMPLEDTFANTALLTLGEQFGDKLISK